MANNHLWTVVGLKPWLFRFKKKVGCFNGYKKEGFIPRAEFRGHIQSHLSIPFLSISSNITIVFYNNTSSPVNMKFFAALIAFAGAALAQNAAIGLPTDGQKIEAGSDTVVQIQRPVCGKTCYQL